MSSESERLSTIFDDFRDIPSFDPSIFDTYKALFQSYWPSLRLLLEFPFSSLVAEFFPGLIVPEANKWLAYDDLCKALKVSPRDVDLLRRRAVVSLQCEIALNAYGDAKCMEEIERVSGIGQSWPMEDRCQIYLLKVMGLLLMKDYREAMKSMISFIKLTIRVDSLIQNPLIFKMSLLCVPLFTFLHNNEIDAISHDILIITALQIEQQILSPSLPSNCSLLIPIQWKLVPRLFYYLHLDLAYRFQLMKNLENDSAFDLPILMARGSAAFTFSACVIPMEYRDGVGGDRHPNNVLRTLFTLRREAMENVRVTVDNEKGGFKMVAKNDLVQGQQFLLEKPIARFSTAVQSKFECSHCLKDLRKSTSSKLASSGHRELKCSSCGDLYCCQECKDDAYAQYHRLLCKSRWYDFVRSLEISSHSTSINFHSCMALKMSLMAECQGISVFDLPGVNILSRRMDAKEPIDPANRPVVEYNRAEVLRQIFERFKGYCPTLLIGMNVAEFAVVHSISMNNTICEWVNPGVVHHSNLYLVASFANHDCQPNGKFQEFIDKDARNVLAGTALQSIPANCEIFVNYLPISMHSESVRYRNDYLKEEYHFSCDCTKCQRNISASTKKSTKKIIPCFESSILETHKTLFQSLWSTLQILLETPLSSLVAEFFPDLIVPEANKWLTYDDLCKALKVSPRDVDLLRRRAVVSLQCEIALNAYGDAKCMEEIAKDLSVQNRAQISLLKVMALMMMRDYRGAMPSMVAFMELMQQMVKDPVITALLHRSLTDLQGDVSSAGRDDHFLVISFQIFSDMKDNENRKLFQLSSIFFFRLHEELLYESKNNVIQSSSSANVYESDTNRSDLSVGPISVNIRATCCLPMEYRCRSDGDRNPQVVLRHLNEVRSRILETAEMSYVEKVRVVHDPTRGGFKMIATTDIPKHQPLFLTEKEIAGFSTVIQDPSECAHCGQPINNEIYNNLKVSGGIECEPCMCVECGDRFCSHTCRDDAFRKYHPLLCHSKWYDFLRSLCMNSKSPGINFNACLGMKLMIMAEYQGISAFELPDFKHLHRATDTTSPYDPAKRPVIEYPKGPTLRLFFERFKAYCPELLIGVNVADFAVVHSALMRNGFGSVCKGNDEHYSTLCLLSSFANHSCKPNTLFSNIHGVRLHKTDMLFFSLEDIVANEEITVNYIGDLAGENICRRQHHLKTNYGFTCHCVLCSADASGSK